MKSIKAPALASLRAIGHLAVASPAPPRGTGGYGLAARGGLILLFLIGLLLSWPVRGVGLAIMIVAEMALLQYFLLQYRGALRRPATLAWLAAVAILPAVVIGVLWSDWDGGAGARGDVMVLGAVLGTMVVLPLVRLSFRMIFGPHHPESTLPEPADPAPLWFWVGGVEADRATVVARVVPGSTAETVAVEFRDGSRTRRSDPVRLDGHRIARIILTDLEPDQRYYLRVEALKGDTPLGAAPGSFTTFPPTMAEADVTLAFASCMSTGSKGQVFDTIGAVEPRPRIFVVTGDLHYENITANRTERYLEAYDRVHSSIPQGRLYNSMPMAYMWDDHDFGDNDSGYDSPSRPAAQAAYRMAVPSYVDPESAEAIHQAFTIGRVRVVLTDNRSERGKENSLISPSAERWLTDQITNPQWPVVIWVSPTPWVSSDDRSDNWGAYPEQRRRIADAIGRRSANLLMVSGDAHMVAFDDGTNSDYSTSAENDGREGHRNGFPVLHAASLDRLGSVKGGPFSHGRFPGAGQFGIVTINDRGHEIDVELTGRNWTGATIVKHAYTIDSKQ